MTVPKDWLSHDCPHCGEMNWISAEDVQRNIDRLPPEGFRGVMG